ncbi:CapA family protein [Lutibacter sp. B2]|nr:CapA family protein [Lutibacter sp. B2]
MRKKPNAIFITIFTICIIIFVCINDSSKADIQTIAIENPENIVKEKNTVDSTSIQILAVGDIMVHGPQLRAQYDTTTQEYDFLNNFQFVKPYIQRADVAVCNLETTFGGNDKKYSSFPRFNTPDSLVHALKDTGLDVIATANNHCLDTGADGVIRTNQIVKNAGLDVIGTTINENEEPFVIKNIKGIKVGFISYTYETRPYGKYKTLNGLKIPTSFEKNINTFNYDHLDQELQKMHMNINAMKEKGAELIIFYVHWGNEYHRNPNAYQKKMAKALANFDVDLIFGSHPHVVQPIEFIESDTGKKVMVVYSMGNFLSNQRYEIMKNRYTEDGIMINATFMKTFENNKVTLKEVTYIPTWVHKYLKNGRRVYEILPLTDALNNHEMYQLLDKNSLWRAENSQKNTCMQMESVPYEKIKLSPTFLNMEQNGK